MMTYKDYGYALVVVLFLGVGWEISAQIVNKPFILPSPSGIAMKVWELRSLLILEHLPPTLTVILISLFLSTIFGVGLAIMMYLYKTVEKALYPLMITSQTIPIIALAPIFVLWFGYSLWSKAAVAVLFTFFPITVNTFDGLRTSRKESRELLLTMGATQKDIFFKLDVPSALPQFFSGLKVAVPLSVIGAAIGEWLGAQAGLGYFSRRMMTQFDGAGIFAPIVILSLVGIVIFSIVVWMEKRILIWRKEI
ncbi:ABC transporter permease [Bacillus piscicola]|uniref:ABC transporter permease n=1 Tax=Bacillus piscicola TaxID=1632684 RepID=UPI001F08C625|nr:ABC transporter permease [Bacillus piscicola]